MSTEPSVQPASETTAQSESPTAPEPSQAAPEPPPPFWISRKYIKRSFGFTFNGTYVEGNFWRRDDGQIDIDGLYGTVEYETTDHLVRLCGATGPQRDNLIAKIRSFLS